MLVLLLVGWIPMGLASFSVLRNYEDRAVTARSTEVQNQCRILSNQIVSNQYLDGFGADVIDGELTQLSTLYEGRIIIIDGNFRAIRDTYELIENRYVVSEEVIRSFQGETTSLVSGRFIEMTVPIRETDTSNIVGVILISISMDNILDNLEVLTNNAWILLLVFGTVILALSVLLSQLLVHPVERVVRELRGIAAGHSTEDLQVNTYSETEEISEEFNQIIGQMRVLDESRQEFVSNVSHELKTPLASMKVLADSLLTQDEVPAELYREFLEDIAGEIDRENSIITDLLNLVKMDKTEANLNIEPVNINDMLELILKRLRPIAGEKNIEMVLESFRSVTAEVDESKLSLAFTNLVDNAIKYNREDGWVHVSLDADHKYFYVKVIDSGSGIPEEELDYIFERFYRVDKSHSSETEGTGLGLAIVKSAVQVHKGDIRVSSKLGEGTTFSVRIPLTYIASEGENP